MANPRTPLDMDKMFLEFPLVLSGLKSVGLTNVAQITQICQLKNDEIYDLVGIYDAFEKAAKNAVKVSGHKEDYMRTLEKLERYMTAHLLALYCREQSANLNEFPYATPYGKMNSEQVNSHIDQKGYVFSIMQSTSIGQKIIAMLQVNVKNIGGAL